MLTPDVYLKALATVVCVTFAIVLAATAGSRASVRLFATFTALIGLNQGAETMRALVEDPVSKLVWFKIASAAASLDPALFYAAVASFVSSRRARDPASLVVVAFPGFALALYAGWVLTDFPTAKPSAYSIVLSLYTAIVYLLVLALLLGSAAAKKSRRESTLLLPAVAVVTIPALYRAIQAVALQLPDDRLGMLNIPMLLVVPLLAGVSVTVAWWRFEREIAKSVTRASALGVGVLVLVAPADFLLTPVLPGSFWEYAGRSGAAIRWLAFGAFASRAILGTDTLGISVGARRKAARVLVGLTVLVTVASGLLLGQTLLGRTGIASPFELAVLVFALAASQLFRTMVDRVSERVYGVASPSNPIAAHSAYRRAAEESLARGHVPARDPALQRLRDDLALDASTASLLERLAEESSGLALAPDRVIASRYRILGVLGAGGGGRAFLAEDLLLQRRVALKEIAAGAGSPLLDSALREARIAGALQHPNVVAVHDVLVRASTTLLVTELATGGSLAERLATRGRMPHAEGVAFIVELMRGVEAVHDHGVIHGDIKPANVLVGADGRPKLSDFGVSRFENTVSVDAHDSLIAGGTPAFMSPQRLRGEATKAADDLFAVGRILALALAEPLPPDVREIARRASAPDSAARWGSAREMREALEAAHVQ